MLALKAGYFSLPSAKCQKNPPREHLKIRALLKIICLLVLDCIAVQHQIFRVPKWDPDSGNHAYKSQLMPNVHQRSS